MQQYYVDSFAVDFLTYLCQTYIYVSICIYLCIYVHSEPIQETYRATKIVKYICISLLFLCIQRYLHCYRIQGEQKPGSLDSLWVIPFLNLWPIPITFNKNDNGKLLLLKSNKFFYFSSCIFDTLTCVYCKHTATHFSFLQTSGFACFTCSTGAKTMQHDSVIQNQQFLSFQWKNRWSKKTWMMWEQENNKKNSLHQK